MASKVGLQTIGVCLLVAIVAVVISPVVDLPPRSLEVNAAVLLAAVCAAISGVSTLVARCLLSAPACEPAVAAAIVHARVQQGAILLC